MHGVLNVQFTLRLISCCGKWQLPEATHEVTLSLMVHMSLLLDWPLVIRIRSWHKQSPRWALFLSTYATCGFLLALRLPVCGNLFTPLLGSWG